MPTATSTEAEPTHHLTLTDGTTTYGLVLGNITGEGHFVPNPRAIRRTPIQRSSLKFSQGETEYSDLEPPYTPVVQHDWSGGRGLENFDRDNSRFYDSWRANTMKEGEIILGGQETYTTGHRNLNETAFTDVTWTALRGNTRYLARKFTTTAAYTATYVYLWVRRIGTPTGTLTVGLYNDSTGDIGTLISGATFGITTTHVTDKESVWREFAIGTPPSLSNATAYWLRVHDTAAGTAADHWEVATHATTIGDTEQSADGSAWTDPASVGLFFRVTDAHDAFKAHFFEYRGGLYMAKNEDDGGAGKLYINGDRGSCDTGTSLKVEDATKSWTTDEWAGCIVKIVAGNASGDDPNWRYITGNDSNTLTVSPAWNTTLTDGSAGFGSEYVILGSNKWTEITGHGLTDPIVDVAVADEVVYFVVGEDYTDASKHIYCYRDGSDDGGVKIAEFESHKKTLGASFLKVIRDPVDGLQLWMARNECIEDGKKVSVQRLKVPRWGGTLGAPVLIDNCYDAWNESTNADVESTTASNSVGTIAQSIGIKIVVNDLSSGLGAGEILATEVVSEYGSSDAIDIRHCKKVVTRIKSTIDLAAGDLQLILDDTASCASAVHSLDFPYLRANTWTDVEMDLTITDADGSEAIISAGINYVTDKTPTYTELLSNAGFETAGGGGDDIHANWTEVKGSGTISNETGSVKAGSDALKIAMTGNEDDAYSWQAVTVTPGEWYIFQAWTRGDGSVGGQYQIIDHTNSDTDIVARTATGVTGTSYVEINKIFQAPTSCVSVYIRLHGATASGDAYFDEVRTVKAEFQIDMNSVFAVVDNKHIPVGDQTELITGLAAYGDPKSLWVFKEGSIWSVENDIPVEIPIEELKSVKSRNNGRAHTINDVYLYFSLDGGRIERYYRDNLDDVGPTRDAGLPWERRGNINDLVTYPGMIIASVDGRGQKIYKVAPSGGSTHHHSCVLAYRNGGWHELWRHQWGRIRGLYIQSIPGTFYDRLWINLGTDIVWIPLSLNPWDNEKEFPFAHESSVTSAWNYMKMQDVNKLFKSLKLVADRLSGTAQTVEVEYQIDDAVDSSTWNSVDDTDAPFNTSPTEELDFSTDTPPDVTGRRLRYRLRLLSTDNAKTPRVRAAVLEAVARTTVKYQYEITFRVMDESLDLEGDDDDFTTAQTLTAKLDSWATANTPLTARFVFSPFDSVAGTATGRTVFIEPASLQPLYLIADDQLETHLGQCTLIEA